MSTRHRSWARVLSHWIIFTLMQSQEPYVRRVRDPNVSPARGAPWRATEPGSPLMEGGWLHRERLASIGQLAAGVAHDFNNLLTVILGGAQSALATPGLDEYVRADLADIVAAAERAAALTRHLLLFVRAQAPEAAVVDVSAVVADAERFLRPLVGRGIELVVDKAPGETPALIDRQQLEQVIVNLVVNARDAMSAGGTLTLSVDALEIVEASACPSRYVRVRVIDTGEGIAADLLPQIFDAFFTTKPAGVGTGLGLATCYAIVTAANGRIAVNSTVGVGTEVTVMLPWSSRATA